MDRVEGIERDRAGDRLGERFDVTERVSEVDRGNERSPPILDREPLYRNLLHSPVVSRTHSPLQSYHLTSSLPPSSSYNGHFQCPLPACASDGTG